MGMNDYITHRRSSESCGGGLEVEGKTLPASGACEGCVLLSQSCCKKIGTGVRTRQLVQGISGTNIFPFLLPVHYVRNKG